MAELTRFYFDTVDGEPDTDDEGIELPDAQAARLAGIRYAGAMLQDLSEEILESGHFDVFVRAQDGTRIASYIFRVTQK